MKTYLEHGKAIFSKSKNKKARQEMKSKLGLVLVLSALIFSGCGPTTASPTEAPAATPTEAAVEALATAQPTEAPAATPTELPTEIPPTEQPTEVPTTAPTELAVALRLSIQVAVVPDWSGMRST